MPTATRQFPSGAVRSKDADGERYDLISPIALRRLAEVCAEGAHKYGDFNWERGMPVADLLNHALRHLGLYVSGDRSEDHLGHAAWNLCGAMHSEELWPELNRGTLRQSGCRPPMVAENSPKALDEGVPIVFRESTTSPMVPVFDTADVVPEHIGPCEDLDFNTEDAFIRNDEDQRNAGPDREH